MEGYIPEIDYKARGYLPLGQAPQEDLCTRCEKYYARLHAEGLTKTKFPPICEKHVLNRIKDLTPEDFSTQEEYDQALVLLDPISWAMSEFNWEPRWFQEDVISCSSRFKILRGGRRCLAAGTMVATPTGPVPIEELKPGDTVYDETGKPIRVINTFDQGEQDVVDLVMPNGGILATSTLDHRWLSLTGLLKTSELIGELVKIVPYRETGVICAQIEKLTNQRSAHCFDIEVDSPTNLYLLANGVVTHNSGKSELMCIEILYQLITNSDGTVLVIAPFERQVTKLFDDMDRFIRRSNTIKASRNRYTRIPSRMEFKNGSRALGFCASATSGTGSDKIRGQDARLIVIDEMDIMSDKDIDSIMAILASHPDCRLMAASTPAGWRKKFYNFAVNKDIGFKEFWWIASESPSWTEQTERTLRASTTDVMYAQEYLAEWSELEEGVFKAKHLDLSTQTYDMNDSEPDINKDYILGVDWNKSAGCHLVIVEWDRNKLKLAKKIIIPESEYTQTDSVDTIIFLNKKWNFRYIFMDAGYGDVQHEMIKKAGLRDPSSKLGSKVHAIHMNQHVEILDPITGGIVRKFAKPFIVEQTKKLLEDGRLILPKSEDTSITANDPTMGLVQQMRNYRVESYSVYGLPRYSQGQDHTVTAYMLACGGFVLEATDLKNMSYTSTIRGVEVNETNAPDKPASVREIEAEIKKGYRLIRTTGKYVAGVKDPTSRDLDAGKPLNRHRSLNGLHKSREMRKFSRSGRNTPPSPGSYNRKTF